MQASQCESPLMNTTNHTQWEKSKQNIFPAQSWQDTKPLEQAEVPQGFDETLPPKPEPQTQDWIGRHQLLSPKITATPAHLSRRSETKAEAAPQTSHSPLPLQDKGRQTPKQYQHHEYLMDVRCLTRGQLLESYVELKAHAQRLAAFAQIVADLDLAAVDCGMIPTDTWKRIHAKAREALAQWESTK